MKKSWRLTEKILAGEKTVESRWYKMKHAPWGRIKPSDRIYFKDSGGPVTVRAKVTKILQFDSLNREKTEEILEKYGRKDLGTAGIMPEIIKYVAGKNYCILVFFDKVEKIKPFDIDKTGFGSMSAWITIDNIDKIKNSFKLK
ncbi:MAG: hypothetical protein HYV47_00350 [Candidatus Nealsonbacteria bacterium]|nr:hypothetical protein [Candidatus Nealsonbacteria bacterium]